MAAFDDQHALAAPAKQDGQHDARGSGAHDRDVKARPVAVLQVLVGVDERHLLLRQPPITRRLARTCARFVDENFNGLTKQKVATLSRDVVLQFTQFGKALIHEAFFYSVRKSECVRTVFWAECKEPTPVELCITNE